MHPKEAEVRKILTSEREKKIRKAHDDAWTDWWDNPKRSGLSRFGRVRANMVNARLAEHLIKTFAVDKGAQFQFRDNTFRLILDDHLVVRFKKANDHGVGSNILTQAEFDFCRPEPEIPGLLPSLLKIEIVYTLNHIDTAIASIMVLERDGENKLWAYSLSGIEEVQALPMPQRPAPQTSADEMVFPRKDEREEKPEDKKE